MANAPATLPADFDFNQSAKGAPPDTLPADFKFGSDAARSGDDKSSAPSIPKAYGFTPKNLGSSVYSALGSALSGGAEVAHDLFSTKTPVLLSDEPQDQGSIAKRMQGNTLIEKYILGPARAEEEKAQTAKTPAESIGHSVAEALPIIGPLAAQIGERAGSGDVGGALAEGATYAAVPKLADKSLLLAKGITGEVLKRTPVVRDVPQVWNGLKTLGSARTEVAPEAKVAPAAPKPVSPLGSALGTIAPANELAAATGPDVTAPRTAKVRPLGSAMGTPDVAPEPVAKITPRDAVEPARPQLSGRDNASVAKSLSSKADELEKASHDPFRVRAYRNAADAIRKLPANKSIADLIANDPKEAQSIPGIGKSIFSQLQESLSKPAVDPVHRLVEEQVGLTSNAALKELGKSFGLDPDQYDFRKRVVPEGGKSKIPVERRQFVTDIMSRMSDQEKQSIGQQAQNFLHDADMSSKAKAERAESLFGKRLGTAEQGPSFSPLTQKLVKSLGVSPRGIAALKALGLSDGALQAYLVKLNEPELAALAKK